MREHAFSVRKQYGRVVAEQVERSGRMEYAASIPKLHRAPAQSYFVPVVYACQNQKQESQLIFFSRKSRKGEA